MQFKCLNKDCHKNASDASKQFDFEAMKKLLERERAAKDNANHPENKVPSLKTVHSKIKIILLDPSFHSI